MNFERSLVRQNRLATSPAQPYTIRIASLASEQRAGTLESRLLTLGFAAYRVSWTWERETYHDVYVGVHADIVELIAEARELGEAGFASELVVSGDG